MADAIAEPQRPSLTPKRRVRSASKPHPQNWNVVLINKNSNVNVNRKMEGGEQMLNSSIIVNNQYKTYSEMIVDISCIVTFALMGLLHLMTVTLFLSRYILDKISELLLALPLLVLLLHLKTLEPKYTIKQMFLRHHFGDSG